MFLPLHDKNPLFIVAFQFVTLMIVLSIGFFCGKTACLEML
jgi:hypothetical protein